MHTEMLILRFSREVVDQPIIYRLVKDYDLEFNLLKATIYPAKEGVMVMELRGHPDEFPPWPQVSAGIRGPGKKGGPAGAAQRGALLPVRHLHRGLPHRGPARGAAGDGGGL